MFDTPANMPTARASWVEAYRCITAHPLYSDERLGKNYLQKASSSILSEYHSGELIELLVIGGSDPPFIGHFVLPAWCLRRG